MNKLQRAIWANRGYAAHTEHQNVGYNIYSLECDLSDHWVTKFYRRDIGRMMDRMRAFEYVQRSRRGRKIHRCYQGAIITSASFAKTVR